MEFSIGEWVRRRMDGSEGVVKKVQPYEGDFLFYVDFGDGELWAGTAEAWERRFNLHAHVNTASRDCDGDYSGGHIVEMTLAERCDQFGDYALKDRVVTSIISLHGHGELTVSPEGLSWHEETDEGYRAADVRWCEEACESSTPWRRDHRAEAAGY